MKKLWEFLCLILLSNLKITQQYTSWNLVFTFLQPLLRTSPECMFINSATVWGSFQYGAGKGTRHRLIRNSNISTTNYIMLDMIFQYFPFIFWGYRVLINKSKITNSHLKHVYMWLAYYYIVVGESLNCERQYGRYPYKRQVFQAITLPIVLKYVTNYAMRRKFWPLICFLTYFYYGKEYLEISDKYKRRKELKRTRKETISA